MKNFFALLLLSSSIAYSADSPNNSVATRLAEIAPLLSPEIRAAIESMSPREIANFKAAVAEHIGKIVPVTPPIPEDMEAFHDFLNNKLKTPELREAFNNAPEAKKEAPPYKVIASETGKVNYRGKYLDFAIAKRLEAAFNAVNKTAASRDTSPTR